MSRDSIMKAHQHEEPSMPLESIEKPALQTVLQGEIHKHPQAWGHLSKLHPSIPIEELPYVRNTDKANWRVLRFDQWGANLLHAITEVEARLQQRYRLALQPDGISFS